MFPSEKTSEDISQSWDEESTDLCDLSDSDSGISSIIQETQRLFITMSLKSGYEAVVNPLERFPLEIWGVIFSYTRELTDLQNCYNASPLMYQAFPSEHKVTVLLPQVLRIIGRTWSHKTLKLTKMGKTIISPVHHSYVGEKQLFNLTLVTQKWSQVVRSYVMNHPSHLRLEERSRPEYSLVGDTSGDFNITTPLYHPHANKRLEYNHFKSKFIYPDNSNNRSYTTRRILIKEPVLPRTGLIRRFWDEVFYILEQHGRDMWHCEVIITQSIIVEVRYRRICKILKLMPNLKTLDIKNIAPDQNECHGDETLMNTWRLPRLENLVVLKVDNVSHKIFNAILRSNDHLPKLSVERHGLCCRKGRYDLSPLTNLNSLNICMYTRDHLKILRNTSNLWPLQHLSLHFENEMTLEQGDNWLPWDTIFKTLSKFQRTLQTLKLKLPKATFPEHKNIILNYSSTWRLNLPQVKVLRLSLPNTSSLDFILNMKHLENLKILVDHCDYLDSESEVPGCDDDDAIRFNGYFGKMGDSNIWDHFPKLRGDLDLGVRKTEKSLNVYFRDDFKIYSYMGRKLISTNGYYFI